MIETPAGWINDGAALERVFDRKNFDGSIAITDCDVALAKAIDTLATS